MNLIETINKKGSIYATFNGIPIGSFEPISARAIESPPRDIRPTLADYAEMREVLSGSSWDRGVVLADTERVTSIQSVSTVPMGYEQLETFSVLRDTNDDIIRTSDEHERRITALERENANMRNRVSALETLVNELRER